MTPSEIAELILPWAKSLNKDTFTNSEAYHAIDCIESPGDVSDALRYMFEHGMVARKKKDGKSYLYALIKNAPDDFDTHNKYVKAIKFPTILPEQQEKRLEVKITDIPIGIDENGIFTTKCLKLTPNLVNKAKEQFGNIGAEENPSVATEEIMQEQLTHNQSEPDETADIGNTDNYIQQELKYDMTHGKPDSLTSWMTKEQAIGYRAQSIIDCVTKMNESHESELYYLKSAQNHLDELIKLFKE